MTGEQPLPAKESVLCLFVSQIALEGICHRTIKVYLSAIRHMHIAEGLPDPFIATMPKLHYVVGGVKRAQAEEGRSGRTRLPITPEILRKVKRVWADATEGRICRDTRMVWAACCLCFFAFLRIGEMTAPSDAAFNPRDHLCVSDVAFDDKKKPSLLRVRIKQSKTDPFRKGVALFLGRTESDLCPVAAMVSYLRRRGTAAGPLFQFEDGRLLTRVRLVEWLRSGLKKAGIDDSKYCSHSFRIGAATTAAKVGIEDSICH